MATTAETQALARQLKSKLEESSPLSEEEIRQWLTGEGLTPQQAVLLINRGIGRRWRWWHRDEGYIFLGPKPVEPADDTGPPEEASAISDTSQRIYELAVAIGIPDQKAKPLSAYMGRTYDCNNPEIFWQGLLETGLPPNDRQRLWKSWISSIGATAAPELEARIKTEKPVLGPYQSPDQKAQTLDDRYVAYNGQVLKVAPNDPEGRTHVQALRVAEAQKAPIRSQEDAIGPLLVTVTKEQAETDRKRMEIEAQARKEQAEAAKAGSGNQGITMTELMAIMTRQSEQAEAAAERRSREERERADRRREEDKAAADAHRQVLDQAHQNAMDMMNRQHQMQIEMLTSPGPSPLEQIKEVLMDKVVQSLLSPPQTPQLMPGGEGLTLEVW
ncbi:MAG: hypothetical protein ACE5Q6_27635, partial [Dehalococcoidia bacterium]